MFPSLPASLTPPPLAPTSQGSTVPLGDEEGTRKVLVPMDQSSTAAAPATVSGERRPQSATGCARKGPREGGAAARTREPGDLPSMSSPVRARGAAGTRVLRSVTTGW